MGVEVNAKKTSNDMYTRRQSTNRYTHIDQSGMELQDDDQGVLRVQVPRCVLLHMSKHMLQVHRNIIEVAIYLSVYLSRVLDRQLLNG